MERVMNICHVNLASGYSGGENQTLQLIQQQLSEGYKLKVVVNPKSPFVQAVKALGCEVIFATHFTCAHQRWITKDCDLIHVHEGRAIYWALVQHLLHGTPYIVTRRIDNPLKDRWLANLAYRKAHTLVGLSQEIVNQLAVKHPISKVKKIPSSPVSYPVNLEVVDHIRQKFPNQFLVIQAAKMLKHKGHDVTIQAAKILAKQDINLHIALLGDGKDMPDIEALAAGVTNVSFEGKQSNMGDWFAAADLMIHPSYSEGLGSVILEAMQANLPVVASNAGGIPDIIEHKKNGLLIEPGNAQQLADAILLLYRDKATRDTYIEANKEILKRFDIRYTSEQYQHIYQTVR
jgi:glycosyltransferase involved in cell wall biosynthesis